MSALRSLTVDNIPDMNFLTLDCPGIEEMEICTNLELSGTLQLRPVHRTKTLDNSLHLPSLELRIHIHYRYIEPSGPSGTGIDRKLHFYQSGNI
jgi:hypothetical protein